jgi:hypothetical protein
MVARAARRRDTPPFLVVTVVVEELLSQVVGVAEEDGFMVGKRI